MEEVLDIYKQPYDIERPVVCMDESSKQLTKEVREPLPMVPKQAEEMVSIKTEHVEEQQSAISQVTKANSSKS